MPVSRFVVAAIVCTGLLQAEDFGTLHALNANLEFSQKWTLQLHSRLRSKEHASSLQEARFGPILIGQLRPRLNALAGLYQIHQFNSSLSSPTAYRAWGGVQFRTLSRESWWLDSRHLVERYIDRASTDYFRARNRLSLTWRARRLNPYISGEAMVQQGIWYGRFTTGIQWQTSAPVVIGLGYEYRDAPTGKGMHILATQLQFRAWRHSPPHID
jgi:hypothetical protein